MEFNHKFRNKFSFFVILIIAGVLTLFYFIISSFYKDTLKESFKLKTEVNLQIITEELLPDEFEHQRKTFSETFTEILKLKKVEYFILVDSSDQVVKSFNIQKINRNSLSEISETEVFSESENLLKIYIPYYYQDGAFYKIYSAFESGELLVNLNEARYKIGLAGGILFITGSVSLIFLLFIFTKPLKEIASHSRRILTGKFNKKLGIKGRNEFALTAETYNYLTERIEKCDAQIEQLTRQLKGVFKEKVGELNIEISQRRMAEASLKKSEEQFKLLFELAPIGMFISSLERKILKVNKSFCETLNYTEFELYGSDLSKIIVEEDQKNDKEQLQSLIKGKLSHICTEKRFMRKDREIIYVMVESVLVRDENNEPVHFLSQAVDITERKKAEQELIKARRKAEKSDNLKTAFLAQMSHEIRTPLNVILTANQLVLEEMSKSNEESATLINSVISAGRRLQRTIDLLLNISSIQSGSYEPVFEEVNLSAELSAMVNEFAPLCNEKNLLMLYKNNVQDSRIWADRYTVSQIFQNLMGNAVKYTLKGVIEVIIYEDREQNIFVEIKDSGIGISSEYLSDLFTPFSQEDVGYKRKFEGNGLGLALVKKYVELNKAEIFVKSIKNTGSVFTVVFSKLTKKNNQEVKIPSRIMAP